MHATKPTERGAARTRFDDILAALAHIDRRLLAFQLRYLVEEDETADIERIARQRNLDLRRLNVDMHTVHLPRLESVGLVERREDGGIVRGPAFHEAVPLIELLWENGSFLPERRA
jgi:hypothetical protein